MAIRKYTNSEMDQYKLKAVNFFTQIRDIPFRLPEIPDDPKDASCWSKHLRLNGLYVQSGYKTRFRVCEFSWKDQKIPEKIKLMDHAEVGHLVLEINMYGKWTLLDCTNDPGLPVYNEWDGESDCVIQNVHSRMLSPEKSIELVNDYENTGKQIIEMKSGFHRQLNRYFSRLRHFKKGHLMEQNEGMKKQNPS